MSEQNGDLYVGSTGNLVARFALHNAGKVRSTKAYQPWRLIRSEEYASRSVAMQREIFLKAGQQKEILRRKYVA